MDSETFNKILEAKIEDIQAVLIKKAGEYVTGGDRLSNFKRAAALQNVSLRKALGGMMAKHTISVYDMLDSDEDFPQDLWEEKIGDHLNYLLLLLAVVHEEKALAQPANEAATNDIGDKALERRVDILQQTIFDLETGKIVNDRQLSEALKGITEP